MWKTENCGKKKQLRMKSFQNETIDNEYQNYIMFITISNVFILQYPTTKNINLH